METRQRRKRRMTEKIREEKSNERVPTQLAFTPFRMKTLENIRNDLIADGLVDSEWEQRWKTKLWVLKSLNIGIDWFMAESLNTISDSFSRSCSFPSEIVILNDSSVYGP